jgi:type II secretory pathway pseudopilin PulG
MKLPDKLKSLAVNDQGFTLLDLLVVLGVIAVLLVIQLPVLAGSKSQSKLGICASHVRQLALACQIYANDNGDRLPVLTGGASWPFDLPAPAADQLLRSGTEKQTFYYPGTAPRFTDKVNWSGPGMGANSTLWNFAVTANPPAATDFHVIGYALALSGSASILNQTNQNTSIQPERITLSGKSVLVPASGRVLVADATISQFGNLPGYANPGNN